ncbi:MAG: ABC transporter ATP-binding protein [Alphaproteobacteria bacterium]|nr:MAG: ABC transporter ATP-binding protein [Alphaproteobacteria bacterium]
MSAAIELKKLRKSFGPTEIIRGVDLEIREGERHAIIGPNGAGKSTLFHLISGRYTLSGGSVSLHGRDISNQSPFEIYRQGLSRSFQVTNIFPNLSVFENVRCGLMWVKGYKYSFWHLVDRQHDLNARTAEVIQEIGLTDRMHIPAGVLTYAEQRALEIGIAAAGGANVIMLDEPTAGMSNTETDQAIALIRKITEGKTLVMVEHDMGVVFDLADRISVLVYGEIIATGTPEEIRNNKAVQEAYLGAEAEEESHA